MLCHMVIASFKVVAAFIHATRQRYDSRQQPSASEMPLADPFRLRVGVIVIGQIHLDPETLTTIDDAQHTHRSNTQHERLEHHILTTTISQVGTSVI